MPYLTRRRLDMRLAQARQSGADQTRTELETVLNQHIRQVGRRNAELCAENRELTGRVQRLRLAWKSAAARAGRERTLNNDLLDEYFPSHDGDRWRAPNVGGGIGGGCPGGGGGGGFQGGGGGGFGRAASAFSYLGPSVSSYTNSYEMK